MGCWVSCMDDDEYVIIDFPTGKEVREGPMMTSWCMGTKNVYKKRRLTDTQYMRVKHPNAIGEQGATEIINGPMLYAPNDPYVEMSEIMEKVRLQQTEYISVRNEITGDIRIVEGPMIFTPGPYDVVSRVNKKVRLTATQYMRVTNDQTGNKRIIRGPTNFTPGPYDKYTNEDIADMLVLNNTDYVYKTDETNGNIEIIEGPMTTTPGPYDRFSEVKKKIVLKNYQYVKIVDDNTGQIRTVKGPATVMLNPYEQLQGEKCDAQEINEHKAVYVFNTDTGDYELITEHKMFFPSPTQKIIEVREKICLEEHEVIVLIDKEGRYNLINGNTDGRAFFLPPYCKIYNQEWSIDDTKEHKVVEKVERFDTRPQYMDYEFLIRTKDNVEIYLDLNFYWQIKNVNQMILHTQDPPADICKHAQSQILSEISRVEMKEFMETFNEIIQNAIKQKDDEFYTSRGVTLHRVEITGRRCKDPSTESNFQEIIKEKTDRIKNLEKKQGENEIRVCELEGQKQAEKITGELVSIKRSYMREEATADGESDADRIAKFFDNLPQTMTMEQKMQIFMDGKNTERMSMLFNSGTQIILKPEDVGFDIMNLNYNGPNPNVAPNVNINTSTNNNNVRRITTH